ncbi:multidrug transporter [Telluribacter sp. SYSU D00476]|uniref:multidrug transporter n=1 Tax=Telluribacter sp. SYSU D00476 TaxID=2811430 RepID=UPI001FF1686B|nr:multidrug transporter [Telluribacter sp. SYSU D00476]
MEKTLGSTKTASYIVSVNPGRIVKYVAVAITFLLLANIANIIAQNSSYYEVWYARILHKYFDFNGENNFPAFFSTLLMLSASLILFFIYKQTQIKLSGKGKKQWLVLSIVFFFLALDENLQIHETTTFHVRPYITNDYAGLLHWAWVVPYFLMFLAVAVYMFRFVLSLPTITRNLFFLSATIFVGGAVGLELFEGYFYKMYSIDHLYNQLLYCLEELMEMLGVTTFIYALLHYLNNYITPVSYVRKGAQLEKQAA